MQFGATVSIVAIPEVVVVGAGPTGLMLACELALGGVKPRLLEERADMPNITRAFAVHARTLELLDARGLADELIPRGMPVFEIAPAPGATLDLRELPTRFGMVLMVPQSGTERMLEARAEALGVTVDVADGETVRADYVVGCDGAHSAARTLLGIDFVGKQYETHILLADVRLESPPAETLFAKTSSDGVTLFVPFGDGLFRAIAWDRLREQAPLSEPVTLEEIRSAFERIAGEDFGMTDMRWSARFLSERRQARHYRDGRVFLAGDAAHVHSPLGGQGMNLGWKLAAAVRGTAPPWMLDSYEAERHPVGASVLKLTDAFNQLVLGRSAIRRALRAVAIRALFGFPPSRQLLAGRLSGIGIAYPHKRDDDRMVGRRMPDIECDGKRLYERLREGKFVLVTAVPVEMDRPDIVHTVDKHPELPDAVLVRPDGYVAWASERMPSASELSAAIDRWSPVA